LFARIFIVDVTVLEDRELFERLLARMPAERRNKVTGSRFDRDRRLSLGAGCLQMFAESSLKEGSDINLSHSGDLAMCIASDCRAGCDVQIYRDNYMDIAKRFFFGREYELICSQPTEGARQEMFFRLWTLKESFMKVTRLGFALPLQDFSIDISDGGISVTQNVDDAKYSFFEYNYRDGYSISCALRGYEGEKPGIETVDLTGL